MPTIRDMNQGIASFPLLAPEGSAAAPSYSFASAPDKGFFSSGGGQVDFSYGGAANLRFDGNGVKTMSAFNFASSMAGANEASIYQSAADVVAFKHFGGSLMAQISCVAGTASVFNETGADLDFRVEGDTDANLLFLDASTDRVGIGTSSPSAFLHLKAGTTAAASLRHPASTAPTAPNEGDSWNDSTQKALQAFLDGITQSISGCIFTQTADATVANTSAETTLVGSGVGTATLPANFLVAGKTVRLRASGIFSTAGTGGQTVTIRFKLGSTALLATAALASGGALSNRGWSTDVELTCRSTGGSGSVFAQSQGGFIRFTSASTSGAAEFISTAATTIDTTASLAVDLTADWNTAVAGDSITCTNLTIEVLN